MSSRLVEHPSGVFRRLKAHMPSQAEPRLDTDSWRRSTPSAMCWTAKSRFLSDQEPTAHTLTTSSQTRIVPAPLRREESGHMQDSIGACASASRSERRSEMISLGAKRRKSGIPSGNAGEYFVMGELLRRGYDAQLADRNTQGYDILVGQAQDSKLRKVQVKTVRTPPWYVKQGDFATRHLVPVTISVLLGPPEATTPIRYFIAPNAATRSSLVCPPEWEVDCERLHAPEGAPPV